MVKLLNKALARSYFLIKEGLPKGGLNEAQDLSVRTMKIFSFSSGGRHTLSIWSRKYGYRSSVNTLHPVRLPHLLPMLPLI